MNSSPSTEQLTPASQSIALLPWVWRGGRSFLPEDAGILGYSFANQFFSSIVASWTRLPYAGSASRLFLVQYILNHSSLMQITHVSPSQCCTPHHL